MNLIFSKNKHNYLKLVSFLVVIFSLNVLNAATIDTLSVRSKLMGIDVKVLVIMPEAIKEHPVPSVYLLHGHNGNAFSWNDIKTDLSHYSDLHGIAMICPDAKNSWYWDSPLNKSSKYESFIIKELYPHISKMFQIDDRREKTAITGLSMGGHGAFWIGGKYPDIFGAIGSMSGGLDLRPFPVNWNLTEHLGNAKDNQKLWNDYTVMTHLERFVKNDYAIIFDCGSEDFFYDVNVKMHEALLEKKVPHDFISRPGAHNPLYWSNAIEYQLLYFSNFFNR